MNTETGQYNQIENTKIFGTWWVDIMSILRPLESSGSSNSEGCLNVGRNNRIGTPPVNPLNVMKLHCRPDLSGMTSNPRAQLGQFTSEIHTQTMELLSKRSLSEMERQVMFRAVRQRNHNAPLLPLSSADSVVLSHSSASPSESVSSHPYHRHQLNISPCYSPSSICSPASLPTISDFNVEKFLSLPALQSAAALERPASNQNFAHNRGFILPKLKSPDSHRVAIDNAKTDEYQEGMRHKLQELERELLSDSDDAFNVSALSPEQSSQLDREWIDTIQNLLSEEAVLHPTISGESQGYHNSNKENPTSQASRSQLEDQKHSFSISSQQQPKTSATQPRVDAASSSRKLLVECATAISEGESDNALTIIMKLMPLISVYGDPMQRLTAYMVEGLVARLGPSAQSLYDTLKWKETPTKDISSATRLQLYKVCPYIEFGYMAAISTILEALKEEEKVHIIDFEIGEANLYANLIRKLSAKVGGPPKLRITAVDDPDSISRCVGDLHMVQEQLKNFATRLGVHLEFQIIPQKAEDVQPYMLDCRPDEALAVNFAFQLHHMPDESVSTRNPRDQLLRMVKGLSPKVVTVVEKEMNTNTAPFLPRFMEALNYYSAVFESLDIRLKRESRERFNIEKQCLARDIVNIVACEGAERIERYEVAGKWRARMTMAGFTMHPINTSVYDSVRHLFESYGNKYRLKEEKGALHFGWLDKVLVVVSAWHLEPHSKIK